MLLLLFVVVVVVVVVAAASSRPLAGRRLLLVSLVRASFILTIRRLGRGLEYDLVRILVELIAANVAVHNWHVQTAAVYLAIGAAATVHRVNFIWLLLLLLQLGLDRPRPPHCRCQRQIQQILP